MSEQQQSTKTYNFKFQIRKPNPLAENEFYRVTLDEATARNFTKLNEKIHELVPKVQKRVYNLTWTDSDGDEIIIGNDESLGIALNEIQEPLYKITVALKKNIPASAPLKKGDTHANVACDSCDKDIRGCRNKCISHPDYDLCGKCEAKVSRMEKRGAAKKLQGKKQQRNKLVMQRTAGPITPEGRLTLEERVKKMRQRQQRMQKRKQMRGIRRQFKIMGTV